MDEIAWLCLNTGCECPLSIGDWAGLMLRKRRRGPPALA